MRRTGGRAREVRLGLPPQSPHASTAASSRPASTWTLCQFPCRPPQPLPPPPPSFLRQHRLSPLAAATLTSTYRGIVFPWQFLCYSTTTTTTTKANRTSHPARRRHHDGQRRRGSGTPRWKPPPGHRRYRHPLPPLQSVVALFLWHSPFLFLLNRRLPPNLCQLVGHPHADA